MACIPKDCSGIGAATSSGRSPDDAVEAHARFTEELPTMHSTMHLYPVDGAVHRVGQTETAWAYRDVNFSQVIAGVDPDPANAELIKRWAVDYWDATHPYSAGGAYVNFMMDEGQDRVRATYGPNYQRLSRDQGAIRSEQRVPHQPKHPAGRIALSRITQRKNGAQNARK